MSIYYNNRVMNTIQLQQTEYPDNLADLIEPDDPIQPDPIEPDPIEPDPIKPNPINLNKEKQDELTEIKSISLLVDRYEEALREKLSTKILELINLKKEYTNIMDQYNHIIRSTIKC